MKLDLAIDKNLASNGSVHQEVHQVDQRVHGISDHMGNDGKELDFRRQKRRRK